MATQKQRYEFKALLIRHLDHTWEQYTEINRVADLIMRHGATLKRIAEIQCSVEMSERQANKLEQQDDRLTARVAELAQSIGCGVVFSGDPRGCVVKLTMPDGFTDDWGHVGVCVPTS